MMIIKLAWKNIWRNRVRSLVVMTATALGLWAGIFASAFVRGLMDQKVESVVRMELSHFQIHHPDFQNEYLPQYLIDDQKEITSILKSDADVVGFATRTVAMGMIATSNHSGGIKILGIDPDQEKVVTQLDRRVIEGAFFPDGGRAPILISKKTAEKFKVRLRSKMVLTLQDIHKEITAGAFRVVGIYESENAMYDEMHVYVRRADLQPLLAVDNGIHEIAVLLHAHELADPVSQKYAEKYSDLEIQPWLDLSTGMRFMIEAFDTYVYFIVGIILLALILSIINTMLMAILERTREIGMLMAVGMSKLRLFGMILMETIFLSMVGGPIGLFVAWLTIRFFGHRGLNLSGAAYGEMGFGKIIYPHLDLATYLSVTGMVLIMAVLASTYPAWKALRLNPVEAIRDI